MKYVVYLDTFFMINFSMDFVSIMLCRKLKNIRCSIIRSIMSAIFGGVYACIYIMIPSGNHFIRMILSYGGMSAFMVFIAFGYRGKRRFIENILLLYLITFLSGGFANLLYFQIGIKNMPLIVLMTAFTGIFAIKWLDRKESISKVCYLVILENRGRKIELPALVDTGNSLREPYKGRPVNILEEKELEKLIKGDDICLQKGFIKIPFHSLGKENGLMDGLEIERIYINMPQGSICRESVIIGVYKGKLASDESYKMIIHPDMLKEI